MSLQNILGFPNKEKLHCETINGDTATFLTVEAGVIDADDINIPSLTVDNITTNEIYYEDDPTPTIPPTPIIEFTNNGSNSFITVNKDIITSNDSAHSLGAVGKGFDNLFCENLQGLSGEVNIIYGLAGSKPNPAIDPLLITGNGLKFGTGNYPAAHPQNILNTYQELTGTLALAGYSTAQNLTYSAVVIGKNVTFSFNLPVATSIAGGAIIEAAALPSYLFPAHSQTFSYSGINDTTTGIFLGAIFSNGIFEFYGSEIFDDPFGSSVNIGSNPNGDRSTITYLLN